MRVGRYYKGRFFFPQLCRKFCNLHWKDLGPLKFEERKTPGTQKDILSKRKEEEDEEEDQQRQQQEMERILVNNGWRLYNLRSFIRVYYKTILNLRGERHNVVMVNNFLSLLS